MASQALDSGSVAPESIGINRRNLTIVGVVVAGGAVVGTGASILLGEGNNGWQIGDGSGGATPPPATEVAATPTLAPTQQVIATDPVPTGTPQPTVVIDISDPSTILDTASIADLRRHLDNGDFTVAELTKASLDRIRALDGGDVALNAMITLNADAQSIADELDAELAAGTVRGPLHGIPVVLKDIVATGDRMPNTAGSIAMKENVAVEDAWIAARLRDAGAVILGKTNLTEWSNFMGSDGLSGYSSFGGLTVNPYDLNMSASGSSTGSAVAVAAGYAPIGIGAEFDGSIIAPAALNGIVGLKPTVGLIGRSGVIPTGFTQDSLGPMTKTVEDAAIVLEALAGFDPDDPGRTVGAESAPWAAFDEDPVPDVGTGDYTSGLSADALQGARIGVVGNFRDTPELLASWTVFDEILPLLQEGGAELVTGVWISDEGVNDTYTRKLSEFSWGLQNYLDIYTPDGPMTSIQDIVDYYGEHEGEVDDYSGLTDALAALPVDDEYYLEIALNNTSVLRSAIDTAMDDYQLDAIIAPTASVAAPVDNRNSFGSTASLTSTAGYPSITIPMGEVDGLPVGLHIFGRAYSEAQLLAYAYAIEQLLPPRIIPTYIPRGN